jgi:hypothetical protein
MEVSFTKTGKKQNWVHVVRTDSVRFSFPWPKHPGLPHDLIHLVVEKVFGLAEGFWGLVDAGVDFRSLNDAAERARTGVKVKDLAGRDLTELFQAEALVAWFTNEMLWSAAKTPEERGLALAEACATWRVAVPTYIEAQMKEADAELADLSARWHQLEEGGSLLLAFSVAPLAARVV